VVAAACVLPAHFDPDGINDSKKMTPQARRRVYERLVHHPDVHCGIGVVEADVIDQINILQATFRAMLAAVRALAVRPDYILVDGHLTPPFDVPAQGVVSGDALSLSVAAASIIAKETRDRMMEAHDAAWPAYGFARHKGYATEQHRAALRLHGPCPIHRLTFANRAC
jgi:ribonuclease HII